MTEEIDSVNVYRWEFDQWSLQHWEEQKTGNIDKTKSWVELSDTEDGQKITVFTDRKPGLIINADRDMWGTWITFSGEQTIAQEDGTMSFVDAMIASLQKLKGITDIETKPPLLIEEIK